MKAQIICGGKPGIFFALDVTNARKFVLEHFLATIVRSVVNDDNFKLWAFSVLINARQASFDVIDGIPIDD